jgi:hypothetical protein
MMAAFLVKDGTKVFSFFLKKSDDIPHFCHWNGALKITPKMLMTLIANRQFQNITFFDLKADGIFQNVNHMPIISTYK